MDVEEGLKIAGWEAIPGAFLNWLDNRHNLLEPGLAPDPTIKVLAFLALLDSKKACTYEEIKEIFYKNKVIKGDVPDNTMRTSILSLGKTLTRANHPLELKSFRGRFQLIKRENKNRLKLSDPVVLLLDPAIRAEEIATNLVEKSMLTLPGLYFLEWSARWWETYSSKEAEIRANYEANSWEILNIKKRLLPSIKKDSIFCLMGLAPGEGLAEIALIKKILQEKAIIELHYLAIDSSPRLLRDHIGLVKEIFAREIEERRLICAGVVADIFQDLNETIDKARNEFKQLGLKFFPNSSCLLITYLGNCLGNNHQDQESEFFSMIHSIFHNRPLEVLVGVSVMRKTADQYVRNWDDFLLQAPRHLLQTKKILESSRLDNEKDLPEFILSENQTNNDRCPSVIPEPYFVRHQIQGQIYRFFYKLAFDLKLTNTLINNGCVLPKGSLILLHSIIKYKLETLVTGIKKCGLFNIHYDDSYHQVVDTENGKREYAVFSAYLQ